MKYVIVCPKCWSTDVSIFHGSAFFGGALLPLDYECKECGFKAKIFPEITLEELEKKKTSN